MECQACGLLRLRVFCWPFRAFEVLVGSWFVLIAFVQVVFGYFVFLFGVEGLRVLWLTPQRRHQGPAAAGKGGLREQGHLIGVLLNRGSYSLGVYMSVPSLRKPPNV